MQAVAKNAKLGDRDLGTIYVTGRLVPIHPVKKRRPEDQGHSLLPPSSAYRWTDCTVSVPFIELYRDILPDDSSPEADEGTRAHDAAARILKGENPDKVKFDNDEMRGHVLAFVKFVRDKIKKEDLAVFEGKVPLFYYPEQRGTMDVGLFNPKRIYIIDLKYGAGVPVYAKENKQLAIYAESKIEELELIEDITDDTLVTLAIYQPRDRFDSNPVRLWVVTRAQLQAFCAPIAEKAADVLVGRNLAFSPGAACKFCPAEGICTAKATIGLTALSDEPVDTVIASNAMTHLKSPGALTREQRQRVLAAKSTLIEWLEAVENQEVADLLNGQSPIKFKLVEGKSNRYWGDPKAAATLLLKHLTKDQVFPPAVSELVSVAQAEKLLKATHEEISETDSNEFERCVTKPEGKPTMVPITDKRAPLTFDRLAGLTNLDADISDLI